MSSDKEQHDNNPSAAEMQHSSSSSTAKETRYDAEKTIQRNPHPDFKKVEASRPVWPQENKWHYTQTALPTWKLGDGANDKSMLETKGHVEIDPYEAGRPAVSNYKLLISAIVPRPVGFVSTRSADGTSTNLAPFSYTQIVNHDPPVFVIGYAGGYDNAKDSLKNLRETNECVINMISEHFIEAANSTSINAPYGVSEWALSGLTPADCAVVKASRVKEAVFSAECKLMNTQEFESRATPGKKTGVLAVVEGVRFWAREDAINEDKNLIDPAVSYYLQRLFVILLGSATNVHEQILKPIARMGGITYSRITEGFEIPRPDWDENKELVDKLAKPKVEGQ
jgi:flavin reductase (DIM6/NTAB) family NADH-FMN oxidoreductase RutF